MYIYIYIFIYNYIYIYIYVYVYIYIYIYIIHISEDTHYITRGHTAWLLVVIKVIIIMLKLITKSLIINTMSLSFMKYKLYYSWFRHDWSTTLGATQFELDLLNEQHLLSTHAQHRAYSPQIMSTHFVTSDFWGWGLSAWPLSRPFQKSEAGRISGPLCCCYCCYDDDYYYYCYDDDDDYYYQY